MRPLGGIVLCVVGVLVILGSLLSAFGAILWDVAAIGTGNSLLGPERADAVPNSIFLLGVPVGFAISYAGWLLGRSSTRGERAGSGSRRRRGTG